MAKKKDYDYFAFFCKSADIACEAAEYLHKRLVEYNKDTFEENMNEIHAIEHRADSVKNEMIEVLAHEFIAPIAREDISRMAHILDDIVDDIERGRMKDGYFNSCYQTQMPEKRFLFRPNHELYCAGHLIEAAIAYDKATGKSKFLNLMKDYASLIKKVFMEEKSA